MMDILEKNGVLPDQLEPASGGVAPMVKDWSSTGLTMEDMAAAIEELAEVIGNG